MCLRRQCAELCLLGLPFVAKLVLVSFDMCYVRFLFCVSPCSCSFATTSFGAQTYFTAFLGHDPRVPRPNFDAHALLGTLFGLGTRKSTSDPVG